jgi:hypothetical protein
MFFIRVGRFGAFFLLMVMFIAWMISIYLAKKNKLPNIRKIAGLQVIEEAIGRSVEIGRPIAYTTGYPPLTQPERAPGVLAGLSVLGYVSRMAAKLGVKTLVGCAFADVYTMAQSIVKEAYASVGAEDIHKPEDIYYFSPDQFAYGTGMAWLCEKEKPGGCFYIGTPLGESVVICEGMRRSGGICIGASGLYFTTAALMAVLLDYVIIGEELWAASAFVSKDPELLAGISSQDILKLVTVALIIIGVFSIALFGRTGDLIKAFFSI